VAAAKQETPSRVGSKPDGDEAKKGKKGMLIVLIIVAVVLTLITAFVVLVGFNLFGVRDKYFSGVIEKIPVLNSIFPSTEKETKPEADEEQLRIRDLLNEIKDLNGKIADYEAEQNRLYDEIDAYIAELKPLREESASFEEWRKQKDEWETGVVRQDPAFYEQFYRNMFPDKAEELYSDSVRAIVVDKKVRDFINTIKPLDPKKAAQTLEQLITDGSIAFVIDILQALDIETRTAIMGNMSTANLAAIFKLTNPFDS